MKGIAIASGLPGGAEREKWYAAGLRFECTRCGHCCTGGPGSVRVSDEEVVGLAELTGLDGDVFRKLYTHLLPDGSVSLRETRGGACVFFDAERGCTVYQQRPRQCRTWPFWRKVMETSQSWETEAQGCPGMNRGALRNADEIDATSDSDGTSYTGGGDV